MDNSADFTIVVVAAATLCIGAAAFVAIGIQFRRGRWLRLIAGNTFASDDELGSPEQKALGRRMSVAMFVGGLALVVQACFHVSDCDRHDRRRRRAGGAQSRRRRRWSSACHRPPKRQRPRLNRRVVDSGGSDVSPVLARRHDGEALAPPEFPRFLSSGLCADGARRRTQEPAESASSAIPSRRDRLATAQ